MSAEPDIVERLRAAAEFVEWTNVGAPHYKGDVVAETSPYTVINDAIAEIDRLRTALATEYARGVKDSATKCDRLADMFSEDTRDHVAIAWACGTCASAIRALVKKP